MSSSSSIEWTDATWNPVSGCTKVSPGCDHCYAETFAERWRGIPGHCYEQGFDLKLHPDRLADPLGWKRPRRIFVNSMSDPFHADVPEDYIGEVWRTMAAADQHTFQVLTKRAERMERVVRRMTLGRQAWWPDEGDGLGRVMWHPNRFVPRNVWLGVSVESPTYYSRIRHLARTPAAVRFLSCEPLLEPLPDLPLDGIGWVIVGGESGPGARRMDVEWARDIVARCRRVGVPVFVKQLGAVWAREYRRTRGGWVRANCHLSPKGGEPEEWPADLRVREFPVGAGD